MKKIANYIIFVFLIILGGNNVYAASGDSVMNAPSTTSTPSMSYQAATTSSGNTYSYTYVTQYQTSTCPAGLTVNGSSIYNSAQRQIISTYLGSQLVSTQTTAWTDINTDCVGYQYQTLSCPAGYTGSITQQRKVGTTSGSNGALQYDPWVTTANNCVPAGTIFNITVGEYMTTGLWTEPYWGYGNKLVQNLSGGFGYVVGYGSMNTGVYIAGLQVTDIYWNGTPGYFTIYPNSITIIATDGGSQYSLICTSVSINGTPLSYAGSYYSIAATYSNFQSVLAPYNYVGAQIQMILNDCSPAYVGPW